MKTASIALFSLFMACAPPKVAPHLSEFPKLTDSFSLPKDPSRFQIDHNRFVFGNTCRMGNIDWSVGVDDKSRIIYFETSDMNFSTPEGLSIKSTLKDVMKKGGTSPTLEFGAVYKSRLPSGWYAVFLFGKGVPNETVPSTENPTWFCMQMDSQR